MSSSFWVLVAIACNVGAQVAIKLGATTEISLKSLLSLPVIFGLSLYGISFVLTIKIYAHYPLGIISPIMTGSIFLLISLVSIMFFSEALTLEKIGGILLISGGIWIISQGV